MVVPGWICGESEEGGNIELVLVVSQGVVVDKYDNILVVVGIDAEVVVLQTDETHALQVLRTAAKVVIEVLEAGESTDIVAGSKVVEVAAEAESVLVEDKHSVVQGSQGRELFVEVLLVVNDCC